MSGQSGRPKPLFAAAAVQIIGNKAHFLEEVPAHIRVYTKWKGPNADSNRPKTSWQSEIDEEKSGDNLENLKLDLAPSTLDAILAAQKPPAPAEESSSKHKKNQKDNEETDSAEFDYQWPSSERRRRRKSSLTETATSDLEFPSSEERRIEIKRRKKSLPAPGDHDYGEYPKKKKKKHKKHKRHKHQHIHDRLRIGPPRRRRRSSSSSPKILYSNLPIIPSSAIFVDDISPAMCPHDQAFALDKKGNKDLWYFGSVFKLHLPKYKPQKLNCLGNPEIYIPTREERTSETKHKTQRYFGRVGRNQIKMQGAQLLSNSKKIENGSNDYLPLPRLVLEEKRSSTLGSYSCLDESTKLYIEGKGSNYSRPTETLTDDFVIEEIFHKVAEFNEKTRKDPKNVQMWLDFVDFQDVVAQEDKSFSSENVRLKEVYQPTKATIEKKLNILEKALEANPASLPLKLAQMELYQDVWDTAQLEKAWEDLLFTYSSDVTLWRQYLGRQQSKLSKFTFSQQVKNYHKCFQRLIPILDGQVTVVNKAEDLEENMIDLFDQYCSFLRDSGYTERAVCSYQAMIELNLFCPANHNLSSSKQRVAGFRHFWECNVYRFGESGAQGWGKWSETNLFPGHNSQFPAVDTDNIEDQIIQEKITRSEKWLRIEKMRQGLHLLPWRSEQANQETDEDCEDPDRLVPFELISPALFRITKSQSCRNIVCLFLRFLGVTSPRIDRLLQTLTGGQRSQFDQFSLTSLSQSPYFSEFFTQSISDTSWRMSSNSLIFIKEILEQSERYFTGFNRNLFTLLRLDLEVIKHGVWKVCDLQKPERKEIKKFGKILLRETHNRSNLILWDLYIRLVWACSLKSDDTLHMINTALEMFLGTIPQPNPAQWLGLCSLCKTYCQYIIHFEPLEHTRGCGRRKAPVEDNKEQVMASLSALLDNKKLESVSHSDLTPAFMLRMKKRFEKKIEDSIDQLSLDPGSIVVDTLLALVDCFALFQFCAIDIKSANQVYESVREKVKVCGCEKSISSYVNKQLYQSQIFIVSNILQTSTTSRMVLKKLIDSALTDFPECPVFQAAFISFESRSYIFGRLRNFYDKTLKSSSSVTTSLSAVASEMLRHNVVLASANEGSLNKPDVGTVHRLRSMFERVLQKKSSRNCPLLWKLYLNFEMNNGSVNRAKGILYRGLQSCPWAKILYLEGISVFGDAELQEMTDLMTEKEIRMHAPVEEVDLLITAAQEENPSEEEAAIEEGEDMDIKPEIDGLKEETENEVKIEGQEFG